MHKPFVKLARIFLTLYFCTFVPSLCETLRVDVATLCRTMLWTTQMTGWSPARCVGAGTTMNIFGRREVACRPHLTAISKANKNLLSIQIAQLNQFPTFITVYCAALVQCYLEHVSCFVNHKGSEVLASNLGADTIRQAEDRALPSTPPAPSCWSCQIQCH